MNCHRTSLSSQQQRSAIGLARPAEAELLSQRKRTPSKRGQTCSVALKKNATTETEVVSNRLRKLVEERTLSAEELAGDAESRECAVALAKVGWDTKAEDISVLHVAPLIYWCSYMVILNVKSRPQQQAVVAKIEKEAAVNWSRRVSEEASSRRGSSWEALDFMDVVVHIFTPEQREFYDLDAYYGLAEEVELPFLLEEQGREQWSKSTNV